MERASQTLAQRRVFLNIPYDGEYEENFLALIAALISIGRNPRCAADVPVKGEYPMARIFRLLRGCKASIHDLCRVTTMSSGTEPAPETSVMARSQEASAWPKVRYWKVPSAGATSGRTAMFL